VAGVTALLDGPHPPHPDAKDTTTRGWTALMAAAYRGRRATVALLLDRGADLEVKEMYGRTALMWAAEYGRREVVTMLLDRGAATEAKSVNGHTALIIAAEGGEREVVALLLDRGADASARSDEGKTALDYAKTKEIKDLLRVGRGQESHPV
jgi:uncharacterized protein